MRLKRFGSESVSPHMKKIILLLLLIFFASSAHAQCTGSGTTWSCAAGSTVAQIQSAINSASDGATITLAAGTYTGGRLLLNASHGATIICATAPLSVGAAATNPCTLNTTGEVFGSASDPIGTNTHFYRFSGFTVNQSSGQFALYFCDQGGCNGTFTQMRIDHNTFNLATGGVAVALIGGAVDYYGVIDHNLVNSAGSVMLTEWTGSTNNSPPASPQGTANNMFVENNTINITTMTNASDGCVDGWGGSAYVFRYNTSVNCLWTLHGVTHAGGPQNVEFYNNSVSVNAGSVSQGVQDCYRCFHHQGSGEFIAFNNSFTAYSGKNSDAIAMADYRDYSFGSGGPGTSGTSIDSGMLPCDGTQSIDGNRTPTTTWYGYPCWRQPGRDFATGRLVPMYNWNNHWSDTAGQISLTLEGFGGTPPPNCIPQTGGTCEYFDFHMQYNREAYNAVSASAQTSPTSPFNGTTGMGFGTLSNRPTTCTTGSEPGSGVGYFATDVGAQGTLYRCSATNVWTVQYTPYTYPHPLLQGGGNSSSVVPPSGLSAIVN
jgi:hypothetical protein